MPHKVMARDISTGFVRRFTLWEKSGTVKNESYAVEILNFWNVIIVYKILKYVINLQHKLIRKNKIKKIKVFLKNRLTNYRSCCIIISTKNKTPNQNTS